MISVPFDYILFYFVTGEEFENFTGSADDQGESGEHVAQDVGVVAAIDLNGESLHEHDRPFQCEVCTKRFRTKANLKTHSKTHLDVWPFECAVCKKKFRQRFSLNRHNLIHLDLRPFECEVCGKKFRQKAHLNGHRKLHQ